MKAHRQFLPRMEFDLLDLPGNGIRAVHPCGSADSVKNLIVTHAGSLSSLSRDIGCIAPGFLSFFIAGIEAKRRIRISQGCSVINSGCAPGPDGQRGGINNQASAHFFDVFKM